MKPNQYGGNQQQETKEHGLLLSEGVTSLPFYCSVLAEHFEGIIKKNI